MRLLSRKRLWRTINWYPPFLGAGIHMTELAEDFTYCRVRLKLRWWNRNVVGTQFGGSLYAMTDPFFMLLLMQIMSAREYIIWDKAATIRFRRPGQGDVYAEFRIRLSRVEEMRREVAEAGGKKDFVFHTEVKNKEGEVVAEVEKVIYVREKQKNG
jgi:acyl-coenzyme A thioesterase PaaI-like protein